MDVRLSSNSSKPNAKLGLGCLVLFALPFAAFVTFDLYSEVKKLATKMENLLLNATASPA